MNCRGGKDNGKQKALKMLEGEGEDRDGDEEWGNGEEKSQTYIYGVIESAPRHW